MPTAGFSTVPSLEARSLPPHLSAMRDLLQVPWQHGRDLGCLAVREVDTCGASDPYLRGARLEGTPSGRLPDPTNVARDVRDRDQQLWRRCVGSNPVRPPTDTSG